MSEEELFEAEAAEAAAEPAGEEEVEEPEIDINAALLEVMVRRTEILEKLARGEAPPEAVREELEAVRVPVLGGRRRRR
ncbi:MAG: hypothetical protein GXO15_03830 [Crenarchaeota archaeon]|nr:hypothetical protein [Thermoproteota archaeon]